MGPTALPQASPTPHPATVPSGLPTTQPIMQQTISSLAQNPNAVNEVYAAICSQIVKEQGQIIGAFALEQANKVTGLKVDPSSYQCVITADGRKVVEELIDQYRDFFGNAAVEVCREAASRFISRLPDGAMPASLQ